MQIFFYLCEKINNMRKEDSLSMQVSRYLQMQYPNVIFHLDLSSGMRLSIGMATRNKRINPWVGFPDLFIAQPNDEFHGLFIELKASTIYKKDGSLKSNEHVEKQDKFLTNLKQRGYFACFGIGFDETKKIIDNYLKK